MAKQPNEAPVPSLQVGMPFNPVGLFTGIFIPEALVRTRAISAGAKLVYGRLARYAGQNGKCYPAISTLAAEVGMGDRQCRRYVAELERAKLLRRSSRFAGRCQASNAFEFLWHSLFDVSGSDPSRRKPTQPTREGVSDLSGEGMSDVTGEGVSDLTAKESQDEESHSEEPTTDLDCPLTNRKNRDSRPDILPPSHCRPYPHLRESLAQYMMSDQDDEKVYPRDRHLVEIMDAAGGATEDDVIHCLAFLRKERGLKPGTKSGPRHFSWFPTVVGDYFRRRRLREGTTDPAAACPPHLSPAEFDALSDAF